MIFLLQNSERFFQEEAFETVMNIQLTSEDDELKLSRLRGWWIKIKSVERMMS